MLCPYVPRSTIFQIDTKLRVHVRLDAKHSTHHTEAQQYEIFAGYVIRHSLC